MGFGVGREGRGVRGRCRGAWGPGSVEKDVGSVQRGVGSGVGREGRGVRGRGMGSGVGKEGRGVRGQ